MKVKNRRAPACWHGVRRNVDRGQRDSVPRAGYRQGVLGCAGPLQVENPDEAVGLMKRFRALRGQSTLLLGGVEDFSQTIAGPSHILRAVFRGLALLGLPKA